VRSADRDLRTAHLGYCTTHVWSHTHHTCQVRNKFLLTLILLTLRKWWTPNNASKWQMGFNLAFKGLKVRSNHRGDQANDTRATSTVQKIPFVLLFHTRCLSPLLRKRTIYPLVLSIRAPWQVSTSCWASVATDCELTAGHEASSTVGRLTGSTEVYVLPTQCIYYVFCVDLRTNSDYFPIQH
jgi:hypothetical protein